MKSRVPRVFPALLRHWRGKRGLSQLDLALSAEVSARHVSFLETGRAQPSREMVLRLADALDVPMRDQNALLLAAGFEEAYPEPGANAWSEGPIGDAIARMLEKHEPYPMTILDRRYDVVRMNRGAARLYGSVFGGAPVARPNVLHMLFDPEQARPFVRDWERVARALLGRLHREVLERPHDEVLLALVESLFAYEGVPRDWRTPDLVAPSEPCLTFHVRRGEVELGFFTTVTVFNAPHNVTLDELRIESHYPLDEATRLAYESGA